MGKVKDVKLFERRWKIIRATFYAFENVVGPMDHQHLVYRLCMNWGFSVAEKASAWALDLSDDKTNTFDLGCGFLLIRSK